MKKFLLEALIRVYVLAFVFSFFFLSASDKDLTLYINLVSVEPNGGLPVAMLSTIPETGDEMIIETRPGCLIKLRNHLGMRGDLALAAGRQFVSRVGNCPQETKVLLALHAPKRMLGVVSIQ